MCDTIQETGKICRRTFYGFSKSRGSTSVRRACSGTTIISPRSSFRRTSTPPLRARAARTPSSNARRNGSGAPSRPKYIPRCSIWAAVRGYTVREKYEHAFCGIFWAPCRSSSLQYSGIAASSSRQIIPKSCRKRCKAIKSCIFCGQTRRSPQRVPRGTGKDFNNVSPQNGRF